MVAATSSAISTASKLCCSSSDCRRLNPAKKKAMASMKLAIQNPIHFSSDTTAKGSFSIQAIDHQREEAEEEEEDSSIAVNNRAFTSKEDLDYLWKLLVGSIIGAAVIKYGSVVFPEITRPNLTLALLIIISPVVIAVLLLINQSRKEKPS